jgi:hypothetical protein
MIRAAFALLLCSTAATAQDGVARLYGYGYDLDSGRYAFTEIIEQRLAGGQWVGGGTTYFDPDGREIGRKTLDFSRDPFVPVYRLDLSDGYAEAITDNGATIAMERRLPGAQPGRDTERKEGLLTADAGLPRLLRAHFAALARGEVLKFRVVAPSRLETFKFRARQVEDVQFEGKPARQVRVDMDSMLSLFAGPLHFTFDPESGKLLEFRGMTNVRNPATGDPFKVRISYYSTPPKDAPPLPPLK